MVYKNIYGLSQIIKILEKESIRIEGKEKAYTFIDKIEIMLWQLQDIIVRRKLLYNLTGTFSDTEKEILMHSIHAWAHLAFVLQKRNRDHKGIELTKSDIPIIETITKAEVELHLFMNGRKV